MRPLKDTIYYMFAKKITMTCPHCNHVYKIKKPPKGFFPTYMCPKCGRKR